MKKPQQQYIRIGTVYYKIVEVPLISGDFLVTLRPWNVDCLKQDYGRDILATIPKYDGFCVIPEHINYRQVVGTFYNKYLPFVHKPIKGECPKTLGFIRHIFQEQYELGLDYIKILLEQPTQKLPILCLISKERGTGKTTFMMFLKLIFGGNMTINTNEDFRSNFNSEWANKLIVGIEETFLDKKEDSEKIKNLGTASIYKSEAKGQDRSEIEFFAKLLISSNNEDNFILIEPGETRYWVIKVRPFEYENTKMLKDLELEIPNFLYFLINRPYSTKNKTRMWFDYKLIETSALHRVIKRCRNRLEIELANILVTIMDIKEVGELSFCINDAQDWLSKKGFKGVETLQIKRILQNEWKLEPSNNSNAYVRYSILSDGTFMENNSRGRYYRVTKEFITQIIE